MKKTITINGPNGTFTGSVEVLFNHKAPISTSVKNPEGVKPFHVIRGTVVDMTYLGKEFLNKKDAVVMARQMEEFVTGELTELATKVEQANLSVIEELKNQGYE